MYADHLSRTHGCGHSGTGVGENGGLLRAQDRGRHRSVVGLASEAEAKQCKDFQSISSTLFSASPLLASSASLDFASRKAFMSARNFFASACLNHRSLATFCGSSLDAYERQ